MISVIIPGFNAAAWIRDALNSVSNQGIDDLEILVVDDGSQDDTAKIVHDEYSDTRLISIEHSGPSRARNIGTEAASGTYLQYLDADDLLSPGKLHGQLELLESTGADVAYGDWRRLEQQADGSFVSTEVMSRRMENEPELELFGTFWCPPAAYLFKKAIVDQVGGWNESLPVIQDARFALDCALHGGRFVRCPGLMADYRVHAAQSVSRRDPVAFLEDCFRNANQIEAWWDAHGGITEKRKEALLAVYRYVARDSHAIHAALFDRACDALERLRPGYVPTEGRPLALFLSRLFGYRRAEVIASRYRRIRANTSGLRR